MAIITMLTRMPIAPNIPDARKTILFGVIAISELDFKKENRC
jgi:hypothetical protein